MRSVFYGLTFAAVTACLVTPAFGGTLTAVTGSTILNSNDYAAMSAGVYGGSPSHPPLVMTSTGGVTVTITQTSGAGTVSIETPGNGFGWPAGTGLYDNGYTGPLTYTFDEDIYGFGTYTRSAFNGNQTTIFDAYDRNGNLIGEVTHAGASASLADYTGILDTSAEIAKVVVSNTIFSGNYIYIGNLDLVTTNPEPGTWVAAVTGLMVTGVLRGRHRPR